MENQAVFVCVRIHVPLSAPEPQIGYVLYPPSGAQWDLTDHNNMMFVTMCFCWHLAVSLLTVGALYCATSW